MKELSERFHESCSAAILQGTDAVYVARVPAGRIMSVAISIGTRLPAFHTSIGRVQLGFLDDDEIWRRLRSLRMEAYTPSTIIDVQALFERVRSRPRSRASPSSTRSWSAACAPSPCRSSIAQARRSPRSTSPRTRPAPPATRCASASCRRCANGGAWFGNNCVRAERCRITCDRKPTASDTPGHAKTDQCSKGETHA